MATDPTDLPRHRVLSWNPDSPKHAQVKEPAKDSASDFLMNKGFGRSVNVCNLEPTVVNKNNLVTKSRF